MLPDFKNHIIYSKAGAIKEICNPLTSFNTSYFNFVRRYDDNSEVCLTSDPKWTEYFYTKGLYKKVMTDRIFIENAYLANKLKVIPWTQFTVSPVREAQSKLFGIGIGISIICIHDKYADFFHFGTDEKNSFMNEVYSNFSDCLIQFIHYFYDKAESIISLSCQKENRIYLSDRIPYKKQPALPHEDLDIPKFIEKTIPKRFLIHRKEGSIYITRQEMKCINLFTYGKTATEIGEELGISKRTVEAHINNVKFRFGFHTGTKKADLISAIINSKFDIQRLLPSDIIV